MRTTKIFKSGNSQAVRLPKDYQLNSEIVEIFRRGDEIIIREIPKNLEQAFEILTKLNGIFDDREDTIPQERDYS